MTKKDDPFERIRISQRYSKKVTITIAKRFMPKTFMPKTFMPKTFMPKTFMKGYHGENKKNPFLIESLNVM